MIYLTNSSFSFGSVSFAVVVTKDSSSVFFTCLFTVFATVSKSKFVLDLSGKSHNSSTDICSLVV